MNYRWPTRVPGIRQLYRFYKTQKRNWKIRESAKVLTASGSGAIQSVGQALRKFIGTDPAEFSAYFEAIELERLALSQNTNPLVDGTLGDAVTYDRELTIQDAAKASKPSSAARFLALLSYSLKPTAILELGTNIGISSAYLALGSKTNNPESQIATLDASAYRQRIAMMVHKNLGLTNIDYIKGQFTKTLDGIIRTYNNWELVFIDGHHQYKPTLDYFNKIYPYCAENSVIVFDDIRWSDGMKQAWRELSQDARARCVVDLYSLGIIVPTPSPVKHVLRSEVIRLFD